MKNPEADVQQVRYVAHLSRLHLSNEEEQKMALQLSRILAYAAKLEEANTDDVKPTSHVVTLTNVLRDDESTASLPVSEALANAPRKKNGYFEVPKVLR